MFSYKLNGFAINLLTTAPIEDFVDQKSFSRFAYLIFKYLITGLNWYLKTSKLFNLNLLTGQHIK